MAAAEPTPPFWKNPFLIAFVLGALALTALPLLQRRFMKAPPPLRALGAWQLATPEGAPFGASALLGKVWVVQVLAAGCVPGCTPRIEAQEALPRHLEDLGDKVVQVTIVVPHGAEREVPKTLALKATGRWHVLTGSPAELEAVVGRGLREGLAGWSRLDAGADADQFASLATFALVDQRGDLRGFWAQDELARGNLINAARLLAKFGPNP